MPAPNDAAPQSPATVRSRPDVRELMRRPPAAYHAIERLAQHHDVPEEEVQREFWNTWDALLTEAKFPDYVLVLTERRVNEALRRRRQARNMAN